MIHNQVVPKVHQYGVSSCALHRYDLNGVPQISYTIIINFASFGFNIISTTIVHQFSNLDWPPRVMPKHLLAVDFLQQDESLPFINLEPNLSNGHGSWDSLPTAARQNEVGDLSRVQLPSDQPDTK